MQDYPQRRSASRLAAPPNLAPGSRRPAEKEARARRQQAAWTGRPGQCVYAAVYHSPKMPAVRAPSSCHVAPIHPVTHSNVSLIIEDCDGVRSIGRIVS